MEDKFHKGISHHLTKCFEAANLVALEDTCKKLQTSVKDLSTKINDLSTSSSNLQMEIESTSVSLNPTQSSSAATPPAGSALSIIDELADRDKKKEHDCL